VHAQARFDNWLEADVRSHDRAYSLGLFTLFEDIVLYERMANHFSRDSAVEVIELAPGVSLRGLPSDAINRWTFSGLRAKGILIGDDYRLAENPRRHLTELNLAALFTPEDLQDFNLLQGAVFDEILMDNPEFDNLNVPEIVRQLCRDPDLGHIWFGDHRPKIPTRDWMVFLRQIMFSARENLEDLRNVLELSAEHRAPAIRYLLTEPQHSSAPIPPENAETETLVTLAAHLAHEAVIPLPATASEAIEARQSRHVRRLRSALKKWASAINAGDLDAEAEIRRHLDAATSNIRTAGRCLSMSGWLTYASLPVATAEAILAVPSIGGLTIGLIGATTQAVGQLTRWRNNWFLYGMRPKPDSHIRRRGSRP
jgi:hypothetical protein